MLSGELILRTLMLLLFLWSISSVTVALLQTYDQFDPNYFGHYFKQFLARPAVGLILAGLLWVFEAPLARWLA